MKYILTLPILICLPIGVFAQTDSSANNKVDRATKKVADTVVKKTGEKLVVVLTEVNHDKVCYKRFDYQNGPLFTISMADISYVIYGNGMRESFENEAKSDNKPGNIALTIQPSGWGYYYKNNYLTEPDMLELTSKLHDKNLDILIEKVEKRRTWHTVTLLGGIFLIGDGLYLLATNRSVRYHTGGYITSNNAPQQQQNRTIGRSIILGGIATECITVYLRFNRRKYSHIVMNTYNNEIAR